MLTFKETLPGFDTAIVSNRFSRAEVSLYGAQVLSWIPEGGEDALFISSTAVFERGKAIRGGIPLCFPWFGPRKDAPSLPQHGFARTLPWKPLSFEDEGERSTLVLGLTDSPETMGLWPHPFAAALAVSVGEALELTFSVTNTGEEPLEYTDALHAYFRVSEVTAAATEGFEGIGYVDRAEGGGKPGPMLGTEPGPALGTEPGPTPGTGGGTAGSGGIPFGGEIDRVYWTGERRRIVDGGGKSRITVWSEGFPDTVVWNPGRVKGPAIADLGEGEWSRFLCVEPAAAGTNRIRLEPGATACQRMRIEKEGKR